ncbi:MAG TPA: hypothetical protein PKA95_15915 [Thermomicrobiales bacterium]|nr:hypothetical protein [Thermomicrobiales bacterium]
METRPATNGCLVIGGAFAVVLLVLGVAVPLAGGTDFNGAPRIVGTLLALGVWLVGVVAALRGRRWGWVALLTLAGPLPFVGYATLVADSFDNPDGWAAFADPPWELVALMLAPLPAIAFGLRRGDG